MYWIANLGPIEIGRVTTIDSAYFVTINAVQAKLPYANEQELIRSFSDFYEAKAYAISFFPPNNQAAVQWTQYQ
jgi:hypothetical protein